VLTPELRQFLLAVLDKAETAIRADYFNSWLKALQDPEGTRMRAGLIADCFAKIRGELTSGS
jgi:hypothetical protein